MKNKSPIQKLQWRIMAAILSVMAVASVMWRTRSLDLTPLIVALLLLAALLAFVSLSGPIAPFVYPIL